MPSQPTLESHHGVLMNIEGTGVLITGAAGIGKSSLALEFIDQGHQLIADDIIDFSCKNETVTGYCPEMLKGLLHTRELGVISIIELFQHSAWTNSFKLDYVIELNSHFKSESSLEIPTSSYLVCQQTIPKLIFNPLSTASLTTRIKVGLKILAKENQTSLLLKCRQQKILNE